MKKWLQKNGGKKRLYKQQKGETIYLNPCVAAKVEIKLSWMTNTRIDNGT